jgi:hypothetical protein
MNSSSIGHQHSSSHLDQNQAKIHLFLAQNMTKIARKLTPNFLTNFTCENYHKILQKYQEIYMNFMEFFKGFLS